MPISGAKNHKKSRQAAQKSPASPELWRQDSQPGVDQGSGARAGSLGGQDYSPGGAKVEPGGREDDEQNTVTHTIHTPLSDSHSQLAAINQAPNEGAGRAAAEGGSGKAKRIFKSHATAEKRAERRERATEKRRAKRTRYQEWQGALSRLAAERSGIPALG